MFLLDEDPGRTHQLDEARLTPLHVASTGRVWVVLVHNYGADPEARDTECGATPAQWATLDRPDVARGLVSDGVQTDAVMLSALDRADEVKDVLPDTPGWKDQLDLEDIAGGKVLHSSSGGAQRRCCTLRLTSAASMWHGCCSRKARN